MKQVYLVMALVSLMSCFTALPELFSGITERGMGGVNYGSIVFPFLLCVFSFWMYRRKE